MDNKIASVSVGEKVSPLLEAHKKALSIAASRQEVAARNFELGRRRLAKQIAKVERQLRDNPGPGKKAQLERRLDKLRSGRRA